MTLKNCQRKINIDELIEDLYADSLDESSRYLFFIGAGCSVSSGIPTASILTRQWNQQFQKNKPLQYQNFCKHLSLPTTTSHDKTGLSTHYFDFLEALFPDINAQQKELARLCDNRYPSLGYYFLAQLMKKSPFHIAMTTNFDNLLYEALFYLAGEHRPQLFQGCALWQPAYYIPSRPLVIQLPDRGNGYGFYDLEKWEKEANRYSHLLQSLMQGSKIIFLGYAARDPGILDWLEGHSGGLVHAYWVCKKEPEETSLASWWQHLPAKTRVEYLPFEDLMVKIGNKFHFEVPHFDKLIQKLKNSCTESKSSPVSHPEVSIAVATRASVKEKTVLKKIFPEEILIPCADTPPASVISQIARPPKAQHKTDITDVRRGVLDSIPPPTPANEECLSDEAYHGKITPQSREELLHLAKELEVTSPDEAEKYYLEGLQNAPLEETWLIHYALFLSSVKKDASKAEQYYRAALVMNPAHIDNLGDYASFIVSTKEQHDQAEFYYQTALGINIKHSDNLEDYAIFLVTIRSDMVKAASFFRAALVIEPGQVRYLKNYAGFLSSLDPNEPDPMADLYYQRADGCEGL